MEFRLPAGRGSFGPAPGIARAIPESRLGNAMAVNHDVGDHTQVRELRVLNAELEARVEARTRELAENNRELEARIRALERFAELTRRQESDPLALVRQAQEAVTDLIGEGFAVYYELGGATWHLRSQVGSPEDATIQASLESALPYETVRNFRIPWESGAPFFQDAYDPALDHGVPGTEALASTAALPVLVGRQRRGIFGYGLRVSRAWTRADRVTLETAVRSLGLALERAGSVAELAARTQEVAAWRDRYEVAVRGSGALLYDWDPATGAVVYGGAVEQITGYTPEELAGDLADWTERLIHPDDREAFVQEITRMTATGDEAHVSFRLLHKDGSVRTVEDDGYFRRGAHGEVNRVVGFVRDVTERQQGEKDLARSNEELRRSNAELEQFAYIASHDLQAPIRVVTSFAEVINKRYGAQLDERGRLYLRQIMENGEHMKRLVDDLLAFSRVHTERRELLPVDAGQIFDTVANRLQTPGVAVTRGDLPVVRADAQQLDQLLQNLIGNGLKYRREGAAPAVDVSARQDGKLWRFAVSDNGIGIEPQYYERIFVIFQRLHGRERYEGTGIGLAVCKKIVERHGGQLWLESTPGQGSTFFFTLPGA